MTIPDFLWRSTHVTHQNRRQLSLLGFLLLLVAWASPAQAAPPPTPSVEQAEDNLQVKLDKATGLHDPDVVAAYIQYHRARELAVVTKLADVVRRRSELSKDDPDYTHKISALDDEEASLRKELITIELESITHRENEFASLSTGISGISAYRELPRLAETRWLAPVSLTYTGIQTGNKWRDGASLTVSLGFSYGHAVLMGSLRLTSFGNLQTVTGGPELGVNFNVNPLSLAVTGYLGVGYGTFQKQTIFGSLAGKTYGDSELGARFLVGLYNIIGLDTRWYWSSIFGMGLDVGGFVRLDIAARMLGR